MSKNQKSDGPEPGTHSSSDTNEIVMCDIGHKTGLQLTDAGSTSCATESLSNRSEIHEHEIKSPQIIFDGNLSELEQNLVIVENENDLVIEGSDSALLKCVQSLLAEGDQSLMILQQGMNSVLDFHGRELQKLCSEVKPTVTGQLSHPKDINNPPEMSSITTFKAEPSSNATVSEDTNSKIASSGSKPNISSTAESVVVTSHSSDSKAASTRSPEAITNLTQFYKMKEDKGQINLKASHPLSQVQTLNDSSTDTGNNSLSSPAANHLLEMAKKIIQEKNLSRSLSSGVDHSESSKDDSHHSDSIITMYLSTPNELKDKLEKLKTNSPVIVMQAGEDVLLGQKEVSDVSHDSMGSKETVLSVLSTKGKPSSSSSEGLTEALSSISSNSVIYRCSECYYSSNNKHYYKQHVDLVHNAERPYKCQHCGYAGKRRHALLEHMVVHSNQRPFSCDHCNACFRKKGHLTNHVKLHSSHRLVHCGVCNIQLPDLEAFKAHLQKIHNTDKLYKCKQCDYTSVDHDSMVNHLETHNSAIVYSCPKCPNLYRDENSLIAHMKSCHEFVFVKSTSTLTNNEPDVKMDVVPNQPANIMCSECGFVCSKPANMKKHMWVHIRKEADECSINTEEKIDNQIESGTALGVLKMNVNRGLKSLPENVTYQCSSCSFTSSDNSIFIKHMLAHKTQKNQQSITVTAVINENKNMPGHAKRDQSKQVQSYEDATFSSDTNVPFVFDKASSRYKCIICGYHCEFQRTIKAHIWKHSGHQSIQYPVFEPSTKTSNAEKGGKHDLVAGPSRLQIQQFSCQNDTKSFEDAHGNSSKLIKVMQLSPVGVNKECGSKNLDNANFKSLNVTADSEQNIKKEDAHAEGTVKGKDFGTLGKVFIKEMKQHIVDDVTREEVIKSEDKIVCGEDEGCTEPGVVVEVVDSVPPSLGLTGMKSQQGSPRIIENYLEGSGSGSAFKGFHAYSLKYNKNNKKSPWTNWMDNNEDDAENSQKTSTTSRAKRQTTQEINLQNDVKEPPVRLRCPSCDCVLFSKEELRSHLLLCPGIGSKDSSNYQMSTKTESDQEDTDTGPTEDSDATESSDEQLSQGEIGFAGNHQKTGICSSLLAVIEQLRERSQSESSEDPKLYEKGLEKDLRTKAAGHPGPMTLADLQTIEKIQENGSDKFRCRLCPFTSQRISNMKLHAKTHQKDLNLDPTKMSGLLNDHMLLQDKGRRDFTNIEKIEEDGGNKYRCSLCHYTSQKFRNVKVHMKMHRQKKPSECSLCDFSSKVPGALQEHMLKHCKVRTYACKFCPQIFNHKSALRGHLRAHKDQEPFLCAYCVFETSNPLEYREHMLVHSGCSSRLRCPLCDNIFGSKEELTGHLVQCKGSQEQLENSDGTKTGQLEDDITDDTPSEPGSSLTIVCVVKGCTFSSSNLKELQDHLSVHCNPSLLVCNLCDFKALHSRSLKSHMKRHANDQRYVQQPLEQYKCNLCGYVCHHLPSLKSHMWRHASDQSYSYEFTNDVINAAIDHDTRVDADSSEVDDPELLDRVINSERKILEGELTKTNRGDGQRPICWVTFRCCSCGFETINKAKLNIHMRSHSDIIQQALDIPRKSSGHVESSHGQGIQSGEKRSLAESENALPYVFVKVRKT